MLEIPTFPCSITCGIKLFTAVQGNLNAADREILSGGWRENVRIRIVFYSTTQEKRDIAMSVPVVGLSVCMHILRTTRPNFITYSVHVVCCRGSVLW